jgi:hypothetical protein
MEVILIILAVCLAGFLYFIPSWIAWNTNNSSLVIILNILIGWTVIGWLIALIVALTSSEIPPQQPKVIIEQRHEDDNLGQDRKA